MKFTNTDTCEAQHKVMVVCKLIFLLVPPHTEIVGVTSKIKYQLIFSFIYVYIFIIRLCIHRRLYCLYVPSSF